MLDTDLLKKQAGEYVIDHFVQSGMVVGLGVGSTAIHGLRHLAHKLQSGALKGIVAIPCAKRVETEARQLNIPLTTLEQHPSIDLTFDGADEVDPQLNVIKGGGGALLHEKIVAQASQRQIILVDASKRVPTLGTQWALPIEVIPFALGSVKAFLEKLGSIPALRFASDQVPYITDEGNFIIDARFGPIADVHELARQLNEKAGIVEHGLFLGIATDLIVADTTGIQHIQKSDL